MPDWLHAHIKILNSDNTASYTLTTWKIFIYNIKEQNWENMGKIQHKKHTCVQNMPKHIAFPYVHMIPKLGNVLRYTSESKGALL